MGTKLEYAINLLASSPNSTSFSVHCVDDLECYLQTRELNNNNNFQITGLDKYYSSTKHRMPEKHNVDFIRKTMQIQEDIFKHQVRELHRLYSVQKMLMEEVKKEMKQKNMYLGTSNDSEIVNSDQFINQQHISATKETSYYPYNFNIQSSRDDPSPRETSGSCSGETIRIMTKGFDLDLERPAEADIAVTSSSCLPLIRSKPSTYSDEESEVELTLTIGGGGGGSSNSKSKKSVNHQEPVESSASFKSERGEDCSFSNPTTPMSSSSATFDQERKHPHWLFRSLSINRTT